MTADSQSVLNDLLDEPAGALSPELARILEQYLIDLEQGRRPDTDALLRAHPEQAESLRAYLASIEYLHEAGNERQAKSPLPSGVPLRQLGDYRIEREIGRGGMGIVYEAEQISLGRRVALKVLPFAAVLDQRQLGRFKNEAQAAAQLHHPHIVPVFSVGCQRGVHFYAMQYIEGQSLEEMIGELRQLRYGTNDCRAPGRLMSTLAAPNPSRRSAGSPLEAPPADSTLCGRSPARQTLAGATPRAAGSRDHFQTVARLGIQAAEALEHAHSLGIVHRDIKPSNLLLDETGKLWITDFGLARFQTNPSLTVTGELVGTVRYMSPEQLRCRPGLVDQRTDIYSLGATLYELATLRAAFPGEHQQQLMRQIEMEDPTPPRRLDRSFPRDLETIILKALSKLRDDRYSTAAEMADDLRRFLEGKPALARRPTRLERACRFAQRHTRLMAVTSSAAALMFVSLTAGTLLLTHQKHRTQAALEVARTNFQRAEVNLAQAREVVDRFCTRVAGQLADAPGFEPLRRELLGDALRYYQRFIEQTADDASVRAELARAYFRVGEISQQLGDDPAAIEAYRASRGLLAQLIEKSPSAAIEAELALCDNNLGLLYARGGRRSDAERAYRQAIARQEALARSAHPMARIRGELATTYNNLGLLMGQIDRREEAARWYAKAIDLQEQCIGDRPQPSEPRSALAATYNNLGYLHSSDDVKQAQHAYATAVEIQRQLVCEFPQLARLKSDLALTLNNLGALASRAGLADAAAASYREAAGLQQEMVRSAPMAVGFRRDLAVTYNNLGFLHHRQQQHDEAEAAFEQARTLLTSLVTEYPQIAALHGSLGGVENNLGMVHEQRKEWTQAADAYRRAINSQQAAMAAQRSNEHSRYHEFLATHYFNLGRVLRASGQWQAARDSARERKQLWPQDAASLYHVACELSQAAAGLDAEEQQGCLDEAWQALDEALAAGYSDVERLQASRELELLRSQPQWEQRIDRLAASHQNGK